MTLEQPLQTEIEMTGLLMSLAEEMVQLARQAKLASRELSKLLPEEKNKCLRAMSDALEKNQEALIAANAKDLAAGHDAGLSAAMLDRLKLDAKRITAMARGLREVSALPDPAGRVLEERVRPNGLLLRKVTSPIGVIVIIFEARPNVTADAASLCFKSGNATILRGGKEAIHSNQMIARTMLDAAKKACPRFPEHAIQVVATTDRDAIRELLSLTQYVDLCIPRGGEGLIRAVTECSRVPVIKHYKGICHVYVDAAADFNMAEEIVINGKVQRPGVCNAIETLLVNKSIAAAFLTQMTARLAACNVELRADEEAMAFLPKDYPNLKPVIDYSTEYLDLILAVRVVEDVQAAIDHINQFGSGHSDTIVTSNKECADKFLAEVDSATVYWNASTRFTDGGEFGMGAEIGISTDKIGARGPMGLDELMTYKWIGVGTGQVRS